MAKQRKPPGHLGPSPSSVNEGVELDPSLLDQGAMGNQALQARLAGGEHSGAEPDFDGVRDVAFPMVERAMLALELRPREDGQITRFMEILTRSALPAERVRQMVDKIQTDQAAARLVSEAMSQWFGGDGAEVRHVLGGALDGIWEGLASGISGPDGTWQLADGGALALSPGAISGSFSGRAGALVADLADELSGELAAHTGASGAGEAVRGFCLQLHLALLWDEEEEEESALPEGYAAEEAGS